MRSKHVSRTFDDKKGPTVAGALKSDEAISYVIMAVNTGSKGE